MNEIPIITIDGPSGTGKGTISQMLAHHLGWHFLDSGSLYRVLAYAARRQNIPLKDSIQINELAKNLPVNFVMDARKNCSIFLENQDITLEIRSEKCAEDASVVAAILSVRESLLERQRAFVKSPGLVTDGRDMGTVVFPSAQLKIYLTASDLERARRRYLQLKQQGSNITLDAVTNDLAKRDKRDSTRTHSPLKPAKNSVIIDTTTLTMQQVFNEILELVEKIFA